MMLGEIFEDFRILKNKGGLNVRGGVKCGDTPDV